MRRAWWYGCVAQVLEGDHGTHAALPVSHRLQMAAETLSLRAPAKLFPLKVACFTVCEFSLSTILLVITAVLSSNKGSSVSEYGPTDWLG